MVYCKRSILPITIHFNRKIRNYSVANLAVTFKYSRNDTDVILQK